MSTTRIDTTSAVSKPRGVNLTIDEEKVASHLQAYFGCLLLFFKELAQVNGYFHDTFGALLNPIIAKALRVLAMMAQIGQVGSFDFAKLFLQKNFLRVIL